jgi:hypothetical protein
MSSHCKTRAMKMETLRRLRLIAKPSEYWVSFDALKRRCLRPSHRPSRPRSIHDKHRRTTSATFCPSHGMVTKPVHLPKAYGGICKLFKRPVEINKLCGRATRTAYQGHEEVVEASETLDHSWTTTPCLRTDSTRPCCSRTRRSPFCSYWDSTSTRRNDNT